jgi:hypothetical protein
MWQANMTFFLIFKRSSLLFSHEYHCMLIIYLHNLRKITSESTVLFCDSLVWMGPVSLLPYSIYAIVLDCQLMWAGYSLPNVGFMLLTIVNISVFTFKRKYFFVNTFKRIYCVHAYSIVDRVNVNALYGMSPCNSSLGWCLLFKKADAFAL